jgi:hypothetical protein
METSALLYFDVTGVKKDKKKSKAQQVEKFARNEKKKGTAEICVYLLCFHNFICIHALR